MTDIIATLRSERDELEKQCRGAQVRIGALTTAIDALEGRAVAASVETPSGPSVVEMLEGAAREVSPVFDHRILARKASALFPSSTDRIKRGVYSAVVQLLKKGKFQRCPGGFKLAP